MFSQGGDFLFEKNTLFKKKKTISGKWQPTDETCGLDLFDDFAEFFHGGVFVGERRFVLRDAALWPALHNQTAGVFEPDSLPRLLLGDSLPLFHGHGDQVGNADGGFSRTYKKRNWYIWLNSWTQKRGISCKNIAFWYQIKWQVCDLFLMLKNVEKSWL